VKKPNAAYGERAKPHEQSLRYIAQRHAEDFTLFAGLKATSQTASLNKDQRTLRPRFQAGSRRPRQRLGNPRIETYSFSIWKLKAA